MLTRKPEEEAEIVVTSFAPPGIRFVGPGQFTDDNDTPEEDDDIEFGVSDEGDSVSLLFNTANWYIPQTVSFVADERGDAAVTVLKEGAAGSKAMDQKGEKMIKGDYSPESRLTTSVKDVGIILGQGQKLGTPMFLTSMYAQIARLGVEAGYAELDPACVIEVLREMAGLPRRVP